uniref:Putative secreted protein n=1 Tax=Amblyomma cajennense TaxID=34607 RepID=A0A023FBC9_AMBCJ
MFLYFLALNLFVAALGEDSRCKLKYLVDDECDSDVVQREEGYTYNTETLICVLTESCGPESSKKLFKTKNECIQQCNVRGQASSH